MVRLNNKIALFRKILPKKKVPKRIENNNEL